MSWIWYLLIALAIYYYGRYDQCMIDQCEEKDGQNTTFKSIRS